VVTRVVARWRYGAFRVVGLEFSVGTPWVDPAQLAPHLAELKYLEFIKMPHSTVEETEQWSEALPERLAVFHCPPDGW
jgi:hypothetical protein